MLRRKEGLTVLELIIVIIIVGILAALALPRFFNLIEYSRGVEARDTIRILRMSWQRCMYMASSNWTQCASISQLDVDNPDNTPNNHFTYAMVNNPSSLVIVATRNSRDGGTTGDAIIYARTETTDAAGNFIFGTEIWTGSGAFAPYTSFKTF